MPPSFKLEALLASRNSRGYLEGARVTVGLLLAQTHARTNRNSLSLTLSHTSPQTRRPYTLMHAPARTQTLANIQIQKYIRKKRKKTRKKRKLHGFLLRMLSELAGTTYKARATPGDSCSVRESCMNLNTRKVIKVGKDHLDSKNRTDGMKGTRTKEKNIYTFLLKRSSKNLSRSEREMVEDIFAFLIQRDPNPRGKEIPSS